MPLSRSLVLLTAFFAGSATAEIVIVEEIIAKVNGDIVTRSEHNRSLQDLRFRLSQQQDLAPEQKTEMLEAGEKNLLRDLIDNKLLVQKAQEVGVSVEAQVLRQRDEMMRRYQIETLDEFETFVSEQIGMPIEDLYDQIRNQYLAQQVLGMEVGSRIYVPREDIEAYYEEHKNEFQRKEGVELSEIFIVTAGKEGADLEEAKKTAADLQSRAAKGEPFAQLAERHSENPQSSQNAGRIGIWRRGDLRPEIEEAVFDHGQGHVSDLIEVPNGYLILKVDDTYREGLATLREVEEEIRDRLMAPMYQPAVREYLTQLRFNGYIEIRPGYVDSGSAPGKDTSWTDPARLAPVTTTKEEVLETHKRKRKLLWTIPFPGGGGKDNKEETGEGADSDSGSPTVE